MVSLERNAGTKREKPFESQDFHMIMEILNL